MINEEQLCECMNGVISDEERTFICVTIDPLGHSYFYLHIFESVVSAGARISRASILVLALCSISTTVCTTVVEVDEKWRVGK